MNKRQQQAFADLQKAMDAIVAYAAPEQVAGKIDDLRVPMNELRVAHGLPRLVEATSDSQPGGAE